LTGRNLAYTYLEEVIEKNDDKIGLVLMLIPVLACNDTKSTSRWDSLRTQFFENNKELILHQLGYTNLVEAFEKIPLDEKGKTKVIELFLEMREAGLLGDISYGRLAAALLTIFEMSCTKEYLTSHLSHS
jgi:hypothetical protein